MKLLLINPNMTAAMTERMAAAGAPVVSPGVSVTALTAPRGFPYISTRAEAQVAGVVAMEMLARHAPQADAAVIAAYGDPGLRAARELFDIPVVGISEAAMLTACMLGERFGVVAFTPRMFPWYAETVRDAGLERRFAGFRAPAREAPDATTAQEALREDLLECVSLSVRQDGADVVILGGAPLAGMAAAVAGQAEAPLVDPTCAALRQAETLACLARTGGARGPLRRAPAKAAHGLDPALAALIDWT